MAYAAQGWPVFPVISNADGMPLADKERKAPATPRGFKDATTDTDQINKWWEENPDYNIGMCPEDAGFAVIDADPGANLAPLDLPPTYQVRTPRGGKHLYFIGTCPPTINRLGPHIDTRGVGSYILLPPSIVGGKGYEQINPDAAFAALPLAIETRLARTAVKSDTVTGQSDLSVNRARGRSRLRDLVNAGSVAISGSGGNSFTYQVACELVRDLGLPPDEAAALMLEDWNDHCIPPWSEPELESICANAANYGQNASGSNAVASAAETFKGVSLDLPPELSRPTVNRFAPLNGGQMLALPEPTWLIPDLIPADSVGLLVAPKANFKSFVALDLGCSIATGIDTIAGKPVEAGPVFYGAHEGFALLGRMHYPAWCEGHGLDPKDDHGFFLMPGPYIDREGEGQLFGDAIQERVDGDKLNAPKLIILDTYSKCMAGLDENDPRDVNKMIDLCQSYVKSWPGSSVLILAHSGKDLIKGTRGSSALEAGVDYVLELRREHGTTLVKLSTKFQRGGTEREAIQLQGVATAGSLVFKSIEFGEAKAMTGSIDMYSFQNVAFIVRRLGAVQDELAITTDVLATEMTPRDPNESDIRYEGRRKRIATTLKRLARTSLKNLTFGDGNGLKWVVPNDLGDAPDEAASVEIEEPIEE